MIGLILSLMALSSRRVVRAPARTYINFFRGTPLHLAADVLLLRPVPGPRAGTPVRSSRRSSCSRSTPGAYAAEVFRAGIQSIERGQVEAARGLGMTYLQAMRYVVVPQAVRRVIPPLMNEFVILIKDTALVLVLGLVASQYELYVTAQSLYSETFSATLRRDGPRVPRDHAAAHRARQLRRAPAAERPRGHRRCALMERTETARTSGRGTTTTRRS